MTLPTDTEFTKICMLGSTSPSTCYIHVASVLNVVHLLHLILVKIIFSSRGVRESAYFSSPFSFFFFSFSSHVFSRPYTWDWCVAKPTENSSPSRVLKRFRGPMINVNALGKSPPNQSSLEPCSLILLSEASSRPKQKADCGIKWKNP